MKKKRTKKLANLLLKNYILLYLISSIIFLGTLFLYENFESLFLNNIINTETNAQQLMRDDYENIDAEDVINLGGWIEVIDENLNVIFRKGKAVNLIDKYPKEQFYDMVTYHSYEYNNQTYFYNFAYNKNKDFLLVVVVPDIYELGFKSKGSKFSWFTVLIIWLSIYFFTLLLSIIIYSRITSNYFVKPLKLLLNGVEKITHGNYSARISLKSKNEFGQLKDAFNLMAEKIEEEIKNREIVEAQLKEKASIDELTGILNRSAGLEMLEKEFNKSQKCNTALSICYIDLNCLKYVNDKYGHNEGDKYILLGVKIIKKVIRNQDIFLRLGGDELMIIFTNTPHDKAEKIWARINKRFEEYNIENLSPYKVSASHGIETFYNNNFSTIDEFIEAADEKMYVEKRKSKCKNKK